MIAEVVCMVLLLNTFIGKAVLAEPAQEVERKMVVAY
ncbi:hypothetical protein GCK32_017782 [Trichostrongylus colubriformis]|uniref:Uncharacterized protein n=1 Tax=Trichostrongylus colubriformis TaxID=6319 RepID=A0AAN8IU63_TRICO